MKWKANGPQRKPCVEIGHEWWHTPLRVEPESGARWWECRYCPVTAKTEGPENPTQLEKILVQEAEAHLRKVAEQ